MQKNSYISTSFTLATLCITMQGVGMAPEQELLAIKKMQNNMYAFFLDVQKECRTSWNTMSEVQRKVQCGTAMAQLRALEQQIALSEKNNS